MSDTKTTEEHTIDFIEAFAEYEYAMEPFKQGKRDLRQSYKDNDYLSTDEMAQAVRAYRVIENEIDVNDLTTVVELLQAAIAKRSNGA